MLVRLSALMSLHRAVCADDMISNDCSSLHDACEVRSVHPCRANTLHVHCLSWLEGQGGTYCWIAFDVR